MNRWRTQLSQPNHRGLAGLPVSGALALGCFIGLALTGCPSSTSSDAPTAESSVPKPVPSVPTLAPPPSAALGVTPPLEVEPLPHPGPFFVATSSTVGVYPNPSDARREKLGYLRRGGKIGVLAQLTKNDSCRSGWHPVVGGGYVCSEYGTTNLEDPRVKFGTTPPNLDEILPYRYARNSKNGTPLYKSVPTTEQVHHYEKYLKAEKAVPGAKEDTTSKPDSTKDTASASAKPAPSATPAGSAAPRASDTPIGNSGATGQPVETLTAPPPAVVEPEGGNEGEKSWWERDDADDRLHDLKLEDLSQEADEVIALRMVKGFYVAIDKIFRWNERTWYKTTSGLVAPADRFWVTDASDFKGQELSEQQKLPIGWVHGWQKERPKFEIAPDTKAVKPAGVVKHFAAVTLTGDELKIGGTTYVAASEGFWMKRDHLRITEPGPIPADLAPGEKWIDIDLSSQTLVAFAGDKPVYATLISSGKESTIKEKDHSTPRGEWRIREKHITTTMDGNGTAAGDLPYSIEDVPYVMYFHKAYALHGAFWHRNYGTRMSHGCVNLAPLDAKHLFFFTEPAFPNGWHGVWGREAKPGSRIVVHD